MTKQHLVRQDTERPPINRPTIPLFEEDLLRRELGLAPSVVQTAGTHLWRHELGRTTERARRLAKPHVLLAQTVVGDFDMTVEREKDVVELEISVDDALRVEVLQGEQDLASVEFRLSQSKLLLLDVQHEISTRNVFHDEVDPSFGLEAGVESEQEWVSLLGGSLEDPFLRLRAK